MEKINYKKMNELKSKYLEYNSLVGNLSNHVYIPHPDLKEDYSHLLKKFEIAVYLVNHNYSVFTEVKFKNNLGRCDILAFDNSTGQGFIIEIINGETKESIEKKKLKYPSPPFTLIFVKISEEFKI